MLKKAPTTLGGYSMAQAMKNRTADELKIGAAVPIWRSEKVAAVMFAKGVKQDIHNLGVGLGVAEEGRDLGQAIVHEEEDRVPGGKFGGGDE